MKKTFVLDTNVLLYDHASLHSFEENDVVIPVIVLEELDRFKSGNQSINIAAREVVRQLDKLSKKVPSIQEGLPLGKGYGTLYIKLNEFGSDYIQNNLEINSVDNKILALVYNMSKTDSNVILVTKDINLRMKAKALGLVAEDYVTGQIKNVSDLHKGYRFIENVPTEIIEGLFQKEPLTDALSELISNPVQNEYFILKNGRTSALVKYQNDAFALVQKEQLYGVTPKNVEQIFAANALLDPSISLITMTGTPGSGKTLLALASAIASRKDYTQIYLARPIVPMGNDIGFLPGTIDEKIDPYMAPLYDNLEVIKEASKTKVVEDMLKNKKIVISPLTYIRGRSLPRIFFIIDESQNLTPHEIKTIITRAGENTKIVFTGDIYQIDSPYLDSQSNGLSYLIDKMKGQPSYAHINLVKSERSKLAELAANLL